MSDTWRFALAIPLGAVITAAAFGLTALILFIGVRLKVAFRRRWPDFHLGWRSPSERAKQTYVWIMAIFGCAGFFFAVGYSVLFK